MKNKILKNRIMIATTFIFLLFLCYLFPYTGDDWAWGSSIGMDRLHSFFADYNGRYVGNLIVILLTRSNILKTIVMALTIGGTAYLSYKMVNKDRISLFVLFNILFFTMSRTIFRQGVVWTAGFTNYAISTLFIIVYFYLLSKAIDKTATKKIQVGIGIFTFILAFCNSLFAEHITVYLVLIDLLILIYERIKNKKLNKIALFHLIGATLGAILMFTNGAYGIIANNEDGYRSVPVDGISSIIEKIFENYTTVYTELITNNILLVIVLTILAVGLVFRYMKGDKITKRMRGFLYIIAMFLIGFAIYVVTKAINPSWFILLKKEITQWFELGISIIYFISILIVACCCIEDKLVKNKVIFLWISISILTGQLFIVQPIGGRCFLPMYVLLSLIALELYNNLIRDDELERKINIVAITASLFIAIYYSSIFLYIHHIDTERSEYLISEANKGSKEIMITHLPYEQYLWTSIPFKDNDIWEDRMKLFYGIPEDVDLKIISLDKWNKVKTDK